MTIYEINSKLENFFAEHLDPETGELTGIDELEALEMAKTEKIENIALYYKNTLALQNAVEQEAKELAKRRKSLGSKADTLRDLLEYSLNGEKFETGKVKVSYRRSESVVIDDLKRVPFSYTKLKYETVADKVALKNALKSGASVDGCHLEVKNNIQVR